MANQNMDARGAHLCLPLCSLQQQQDQDSFLICDDRKTSSWTLVQRVAALSHAMSTRLALPIGSVVMVASLNADYMLEALLGICDAGCIAAPVNHRWSPAELAGGMRLARPACALVDQHCGSLVSAASAMLQAAGEGSPVLVHLGPASGHTHSMHAPGPAASTAFTSPGPAVATHAVDQPTQGGGTHTACTLQAATLIAEHCQGGPAHLQLLTPPSGAALLCFTSGTTGQPKGVLLSHTSFHTQSMAKLSVVGYAASDTYLHLAPLFHIGGLSSAFACIMAGASHVLLPRFTAREAVRCIKAHGVTSFIAVPAIMQDLATHAQSHAQPEGTQPLPDPHPHPSSSPHPHPSTEPMTSVRCILMGGGATTPALQAIMRHLFPHARVLSAYGMTEACSSITFLQLMHPTPGGAPDQLRRPTAGAAIISPSPSSTHVLAPCTSSTDSGLLQHTSLPRNNSQGVHGSMGPADSPSSTGDMSGDSMGWRDTSRRSWDAGGSTGGSSSLWAGAVRAGWPAPGVAVRVVPTALGSHGDAGDVVGVGGAGGEGGVGGVRGGRGEGVLQEGEVWTRGPHTFNTYLRNEQETSKAYTACGWMRTGDVGFFDPAGCLWLKGRAKDMIKTGGENVYAVEVEAALCSHPGVAAAAVVGLPHVRWGETVAAVVVLRPGWVWTDGLVLDASQWQGPGGVQVQGQGQAQGSGALQEGKEQGQGERATRARGHRGQLPALSAELLQAHCRQQAQLSPYKVPRVIAAVAQAGAMPPGDQARMLPTNASGKVIKPVIRELLLKAVGVHNQEPTVRSRM